MKILKYLWVLTKNIFILWLAYTLVSKANSFFEKSVISILIIFYTYIVSSFWGLGINISKLALGLGYGIVDIKKALKISDAEDDENELKKSEELLESRQVEKVIDLISIFIIWLIAGFNLISSLSLYY